MDTKNWNIKPLPEDFRPKKRELRSKSEILARLSCVQDELMAMWGGNCQICKTEIATLLWVLSGDTESPEPSPGKE